MSLQINLLKKTERRYQGIVSMKVIVLSSISLLAAITVLVFLLAGISRMKLNSNLSRARRASERIEPQAVALRTAQAAIAANRKILSELENWSKIDRPPMYSVLRAMQKNVPPQMQLYHFLVSAEQTNGNDSATCTLRISGTAKGELTVIEAKRQLNADVELRSFCGEVKLVSSQRYQGDVWAFALEGHRLAEGAK
ncbi:MAG: hypothetical protein WCH86_01170 [Kiritimatiellales bacterium]